MILDIIYIFSTVIYLFADNKYSFITKQPHWIPTNKRMSSHKHIVKNQKSYQLIDEYICIHCWYQTKPAQPELWVSSPLARSFNIRKISIHYERITKFLLSILMLSEFQDNLVSFIFSKLISSTAHNLFVF